ALAVPTGNLTRGYPGDVRHAVYSWLVNSRSDLNGSDLPRGDRGSRSQTLTWSSGSATGGRRTSGDSGAHRVLRHPTGVDRVLQVVLRDRRRRQDDGLDGVAARGRERRRVQRRRRRGLRQIAGGLDVLQRGFHVVLRVRRIPVVGVLLEHDLDPGGARLVELRDARFGHARAEERGVRVGRGAEDDRVVALRHEPDQGLRHQRADLLVVEGYVQGGRFLSQSVIGYD